MNNKDSNTESSMLIYPDPNDSNIIKCKEPIYIVLDMGEGVSVVGLVDKSVGMITSSTSNRIIEVMFPFSITLFDGVVIRPYQPLGPNVYAFIEEWKIVQKYPALPSIINLYRAATTNHAKCYQDHLEAMFGDITHTLLVGQLQHEKEFVKPTIH